MWLAIFIFAIAYIAIASEKFPGIGLLYWVGPR